MQGVLPLRFKAQRQADRFHRYHQFERIRPRHIIGSPNPIEPIGASEKNPEMPCLPVTDLSEPVNPKALFHLRKALLPGEDMAVPLNRRMIFAVIPGNFASLHKPAYPLRNDLGNGRNS